MVDLKGKKILVVDDDIDLLEQHKLLLEAKGLKVITAENQEQGWNLFKSEKPDAVILDLIMEEHDTGFILAHRIKKEERGKKIPVFILTSATYLTGYKFSVNSPEEQEWINCDGIFNKPIVEEELLQKLSAFFELHE